MEKLFRALVVRKSADKKTVTRAIEERSLRELPEGDVLIRVHYSSLNYKDALSCTGYTGVTRRFPHTPGIDVAGIVETSKSSQFKPGDKVAVISYELGVSMPGGFGQYVTAPAHWVMSLPANMTPRDAMIYGTAGLTVGLALQALMNQGVQPDSGPIAVTGATGGVGCISVALLAHLKYLVTASTGKASATEFLRNLGAHEVVGREVFADTSGRPMLKETWAGGIDTVGGNTLATMLKSCKEGGAVAATGMVGATDLSMSIYPFILHGVSLLGIHLQGVSLAARQKVLERLAGEWRPNNLEAIAVERRLDDLEPEIHKILAGGQQGRVVVNLL